MTALVGSTLPGVNTLTVEPLPPTVLRNQMADAAVAFSVFSHLSPAAHTAWALEFGRIISPGGMAFVTLLDSAFFDQLARATVAVAEGDTTTFSSALATLFPNLEDARARLTEASLSTPDPAVAAYGPVTITDGPRSLSNSRAVSGMPPASISSSGYRQACSSNRRWSRFAAATKVSCRRGRAAKRPTVWIMSQALTAASSQAGSSRASQANGRMREGGHSCDPIQLPDVRCKCG